MKNFVLLFLLISTIGFAQKERVQIKGTIINTTEEPVEGITIFNLNNLEGTITNEEGVFYINVMEGDKLNFDAIQFEPFTLEVGANTIKSKTAKLTLNEGVNQLDEVIVRDDLMMVKVKRDVDVDLELDEIESDVLLTPAVDRMENTFSDRVKQPDEYPVEQLAANQSGLRYSMFNFVGLLGSLVVSESLKNLDLSGQPKKVKEEFNVMMVKNKYDAEYLAEFLKLDQKYLYEFMYFAKDNGLDEDMLSADNELELLNFLSDQAEDFKERKGLKESKG
ncbi:MAG: carboxypeptidase-like regulatory domain-containing protein [Nonlabens sp.]